MLKSNVFNPLIATLKTAEQLTIIYVIGGLLHLVQRGGDWARPQPAQVPPCCTKCNSLPINGQCTNFVLFDVAL